MVKYLILILVVGLIATNIVAQVSPSDPDIDIVFVIDSSPSMRRDIGNVADRSQVIVDAAGTNAQFGLYVFSQNHLLIHNLQDNVDPDAIRRAPTTTIPADGGSRGFECSYRSMRDVIGEVSWSSPDNRLLILMTNEDNDDVGDDGEGGAAEGGGISTSAVSNECGDPPVASGEVVTAATASDVRICPIVFDTLRGIGENQLNTISGPYNTYEAAIREYNAVSQGAAAPVGFTQTVCDTIRSEFAPPPIRTSDPDGPDTTGAVGFCGAEKAILNSSVLRTIQNGDVGGTLYCRVINAHGEYVTGPEEVGNLDLINRGVLQAVDLFVLDNDGVSLTGGFPGGTVQVCLGGRGSLFFLDVRGSLRPLRALPQDQIPDFTCGLIDSPGTAVLVQ